MAFNHGDYTAARAWLEEGLAISQSWEDRWFLQVAYYFLGVIERQQGNDEQAVTLFEQSLTLGREMGAKWGIPGACLQLGFSRLRQGDDRQATRYFRESLENFAQIEGSRPQGFILAFAGLSALAARQQQWERAARLSGSAEGLCCKLDLPLESGDQADYDHHTSIVRACRHEPQVAAAWAAGQALSLEQAIDYALALPDLPGSAFPPVVQGPAAPTPPNYPAGLCAREVEVLRLLVEGLTYAQIADRLVISRRTVNAHVTSIYGKLGVTSRAMATRFATAHHLV
jgi:DNA-binding CsgD family transcriptional regulator/Tfp pilus assembly protein PilF